MSWWEALILGVVQGLTEFLPVSSSGHLQIGQALFGVEGEANLMFVIAVHAATVLSTLFVLWKEVTELGKGLFRFRWNEETQYIAKIILSMIPVAVVGVLFKKQIEAVFGSGLLIVGICLLITAALLAFAYYVKPRQKEKISFWDALIVGVSQACAILPGLSRSGTTIATGLLLGNKKEIIAKFSFLMVLIPIMGEALLDLLKGNFSEASGGISTISLVVGFIAAFVTGTFACKWMISIVKKGKLIYFSIYCILIGLFAVGYALFNH
jgi:undecaprenyl-diphosphatase